MIDKENCILLGKIRKTTAYSGEVLISSVHEWPEEISALLYVHLEIDSVLIPFFIKESALLDPKNLRASFLDISTQEKARKLVDCPVYIEKSQIPGLENVSTYKDVLQYQVKDRNHGDIGSIEELLENPGQDLLVVRKGDLEILIPVAEEIIIAVDHKKKIITVDLPEGLIELNS